MFNNIRRFSDCGHGLSGGSSAAPLMSTLGPTFAQEQVLFTVTQDELEHLMKIQRAICLKREHIHLGRLIRSSDRRHIPINLNLAAERRFPQYFN